MIKVMSSHVNENLDYDLVLFDGTCGLCHASVKFILRRDRAGRFRFSPLQGETVKQRLSEVERAELPDAIVVVTREEAVLVGADAVIFILQRLGGIWGGFGQLMVCVPRGLREAGYRLVAKRRKQIWGEADTADGCPVVPAEWRGRFLP